MIHSAERGFWKSRSSEPRGPAVVLRTALVVLSGQVAWMPVWEELMSDSPVMRPHLGFDRHEAVDLVGAADVKINGVMVGAANSKLPQLMSDECIILKRSVSAMA